MAYSYITYTANGSQTQFSVPFGYIRKEHVYVSVNQVSQSYTWVNDSTVQLATAPTAGLKVEVRRSTPADALLVDFVDGSTPVAADFDTSSLQHLYLEQELQDNQGQTISIDPTTGLPTANNNRITNVGTPVNANDAATKSYVDAADATFLKKDGSVTATGALPMGGFKVTNLGTPTTGTDASTKAYVDANIASAAADAASAAASAALANDWATKTTGAVAGGEFSAKYHAQNAASSASTASTASTSAASSSAAASASAVSAAASAASAAALLDNFDDRYLGPKASDPTLDNDGNALVTGALYFNSTTGVMRVYTASGWVDATTAIVGVLNIFEYVATNGQTTFTGADANGVSLSYTAGGLIVVLNGAVLRPGDDYTASNGTSVVLASAASANDELQIMAFGDFNVANHYTKAESDALFQPLDANTAKLNVAQNWTANQTLGNQADLRFGEATANGTNWVGFQAPASIAADVLWTLPAADGTNGQVLSTDGSGALSWAASTAISDKIQEGNTSAEVIDTGSDGQFVVTTEGSERLRVDSSGRLLAGTSSTSQACTIQAQGNSSTGATGQGIIKLSRGESSPASGAALGEVSFADSGHVAAASIAIYRDGGTWTSTTSQPTRLTLSVSQNNSASQTEALRITNDRVICYNQSTPITKGSSATLTVDELKTGIILASVSGITLTLPLGSSMEGGFSGIYTNMTFEWSLINTSSGSVNIVGNTNHTIVGSSGSLAANTSGRFASRRTAANTFVSYLLG